jgi:hypothetical protein
MPTPAPRRCARRDIFTALNKSEVISERADFARCHARGGGGERAVRLVLMLPAAPVGAQSTLILSSGTHGRFQGAWLRFT